MCYEVKCGSCGKTTWGGCGRHVASVYRRVGEGQHCMCRDWPGVKLPDASTSSSSSSAAAAAATAATESNGTSSACAVL